MVYDDYDDSDDYDVHADYDEEEDEDPYNAKREGRMHYDRFKGFPFSTINFSRPPFHEVVSHITDTTRSVKSRMKALFHIRYYGSLEAMKALISSLNETESVLFRHEVVYVLGQMEKVDAAPVLKKLLSDPSEHPVVRHEAAEALAAVGAVDAFPTLCKYLDDPIKIVSDTCEVAIASLIQQDDSLEKELSKDMITRLGLASKFNTQSADQKNNYVNHGADVQNEKPLNAKMPFYLYSSPTPNDLSCPVGEQATFVKPFNTVDPIKILKQDWMPDNLSTQEMRVLLLDESQPLWKRYNILFFLRNLFTDEAVDIINESLVSDKKSAVFRHEVAFVLGQFQKKSSVEFLLKVLKDLNEAAMVRHEAALSIGSIGVSLNHDLNRFHEEGEASHARAKKERYEQLGLSPFSDDMETQKNDYENRKNAKRIRKAEILRLDEERLQLRKDNFLVRKQALEELIIYCGDKDRIVAESCIVALDNIFDASPILKRIHAKSLPHIDFNEENGNIERSNL